MFIFGSGASLNAITPTEWTEIERHDTLGFNWFVRQSFVRCDPAPPETAPVQQPTVYFPRLAAELLRSVPRADLQH